MLVTPDIPAGTTRRPVDGHLPARPLSEFLDKNSLGPRFAALADLCLNREEGVFATVIPTTALTNTSGLSERLALANRFHIHTILTCHQARDVGLSQHSEISESIVVLRRHAADSPATRIVSLDRLPADRNEADELFDGFETGTLPNGWGRSLTLARRADRSRRLVRCRVAVAQTRSSGLR